MARGEGYEAGRQDTTLAQHTEHLAEINGSIEKAAQGIVDVGIELRELRLEDRIKRERAARLYKYTTLAISVVLAVLAIISYLRGSPF
jgi:hypothetical protein